MEPRGDILLTVAIPTYNRKLLLQRALDSVVPQLNPKIELLISDNASTDGTDALVRECFPTVRYLRNETNLGANRNFLECYRAARGKYVLLLGSDDRMAAGALDALTAFLESNDCDWVFLNYRFYYDQTAPGGRSGAKIPPSARRRDFVTTDRGAFLRAANHSVSFISASVVRRARVLAVPEPERFFGSSFLHTCLMLEAVRDVGAVFGVVTRPIIEANGAPVDSLPVRDPARASLVFGKKLYAVLCVQAADCGFPADEARRAYGRFLRDCPPWRRLLSYRAREDKAAEEAFWADAYPVLRHFPAERLRVWLTSLLPRGAVRALFSVHNARKARKARPN